jgi:hypothetical protein
MPRPILLTDAHGNRVATVAVDQRGDYYSGSIDLEDLPGDLLHAFEEYEEIVSEQMFGLLDEAEEKIARYGLKIGLDDGNEAFIEDLQVFPGTRRVSFKLKATAPKPIMQDGPTRL